MPLFYSEADFQHSLAILLNSSGYSTRLEKAFYLKNSDESEIRKIELDIEIERCIALELKYKLANRNRSNTITANSEEYITKNHGAPNLGRYDAFDDAIRVRSLINDEKIGIKSGYTVFLTNDQSYFSKDGAKSMARYFKINEGTQIKKGTTLDWLSNKNGKKPKVQSITAKREHPIVIDFDETITWHNYSRIDLLETRYSQFKFFILDLNS